MTPEEKEIEQKAIEFARNNKKTLARALTDKQKFPPEEHPVSVFMAGSPGAGKTESARNLIERFTSDGHSVLRIDPDDFRSYMPGYNGKNSYLFQSSTSILVDAMQDMALSNSQSYVFDGTLSNLERARQNIQRNVKRGREIFIMYVYQTPLQAWEFVKAREKKDGRRVPKSSFIEQYFKARKNVNILKSEFTQAINIHLVVKNMDGSDFGYYENIDIVDNYIPERYSEEQLQSVLVE